MNRRYTKRVWYQRYAEMYSRLIAQGISRGHALMAIEECHRLMDYNHRYGRAFIACSAEDSILRLSIDTAQPETFDKLIRREPMIDFDLIYEEVPVGMRKIMRCEATGEMVEMEYTGNPITEDGKTNGHRGWLCLHDEYGR